VRGAKGPGRGEFDCWCREGDAEVYRELPSPIGRSWRGPPDVANPHVRIDERGSQTEPVAHRFEATAPFLDSTTPG